MLRRARGRVALGAVVTLAATLSGCTSAPPIATASAQSGASTCISRVTPDCEEYTYTSPGPGTVVVAAPRSSAGNNREFFWSPTGPIRPDLTVCATFAGGTGIDQQGVVLRLSLLAHGRVSGITVTRNVWGSAFDVFNYHVWNTLTDPAEPFTQFGSTVIRALPVAPEVYPLHLCARTVSATDSVEFVVWTAGRTRPPWGSADQSGQATIPSGAPTSGRGGWFAGHLQPGTSMTYRDLTVDGQVPGNLP
jgi:hypothetical protein